MENETVRIDKWLWAVRIYKTRQIAADECKRGKVTVNGQNVKPSRMILLGDKVNVTKEGFEWKYEVAGCIEKRVGAKIVGDYRLDITPKEEIERFKATKAANTRVFIRPKGVGRPTKKERRMIDKLRGS